MSCAHDDLTHDRTLLREKVYGRFDGGDDGDLPALCVTLLRQQKKTWPLLRNGYKSIGRGRERTLACDGFSVLLQHNPGRMKSTLAAVSEEDIRSRPCFLCLSHLPESQKGVLYRGSYLILGNPMPVFPAHFTIAHVDHQPQAVSSHVDTLLQLMADFGYGWALLYNGPKCGASAPDHFHFQAVPSGRMPIERETREKSRLTLFTRIDDVALYRANSLGREAVVVEGSHPKTVGSILKSFLDALKKVLGAREEPMLNLIGVYREDRVTGHGSWGTGKYREDRVTGHGARGKRKTDSADGGTWRLIVFPRRKHRPEVFFNTGDARIAVSPAVVEMGGILVTPFARDFERLNTRAVEAIYEEVSLERSSVERAIDAIR